VPDRNTLNIRRLARSTVQSDYRYLDMGHKHNTHTYTHTHHTHIHSGSITGLRELGDQPQSGHRKGAWRKRNAAGSRTDSIVDLPIVELRTDGRRTTTTTTTATATGPKCSARLCWLSGCDGGPVALVSGTCPVNGNDGNGRRDASTNRYTAKSVSKRLAIGSRDGRR